MGSSHGKSSTIYSEEKEEILHTRRRKPNPRLSRGVPKGIEGELVTAGWPNWLVAVAGDALNGWIPRRADTFEKLAKIGQGTYSNVYKARDLLLNKVVALKKVRFDNLDPESVKFMVREIVILRRLGDHPNVMKLEGLVTSKMSCSLYLVFDCMEYDLKGIQEQKGVNFSVPEIKCYMYQLLKGLDHCHSHGILHRDVTTSNLLVDKDGILKIADFGLSTFFDPEQSIPLTSKIVTLWYRPPELLLGSNCYGVGIDLWGVGCVLGELFTGKPVMPGRTEVEQLHKIFKLCGSPSDDFWRKSKLPNTTIFKPREPYRRNLQAAFHNLPAAAVRLMDTLLSIEPEYRGTAAHALQGEFFTTEPFACDPSSLPQCPPWKEIDAEFHDAKKTEVKGSRDQKYVRDRSVRAFLHREADEELQCNIDRRRHLTYSKAWNRLEETTGHVSGGALNEGTIVSASCQESSRKEGSQNDTQSSVIPHALQGEFFTTKPFACDPSSLPQCPPKKEIDAEFHDAKMTEVKGSRDQKYARDRSVRAFLHREADEELQCNIDRRRHLTYSKAWNRLEETNGHVSGGALNEGTIVSASCQESSRKEGSQNDTQSSVIPHDDLDSKGKKKWSGPLPVASDKIEDLLRQHDDMIRKAVTRARLKKGSRANWNDHESKGKEDHSLCPSTSTSNETIGDDQISTLPPKSTNMQGLLEEHKTQILKDAQWMMSDKEKMAEGEGKNQHKQLSPPAESDDLDFLDDNEYFGPLSSASKPIDVDRILREHDRQIQESVERAKQQKKLSKARY